MISVCSKTLCASGSLPLAAASLTMTESGVFKACARLPTCVRARSTISRLASIRALVSRARSDLDREFTLEPLGAAGADCREAFGNTGERREAETDLQRRGQ